LTWPLVSHKTLTFILFDLEITIIKRKIRNTSGINTGIWFEVESIYSIKLFNLT